MRSKKIGGVLVLLAISLWIYVYSGSGSRSPVIGGYVGDVYVEFPREKYTFIVDRVLEEGRHVIKDNLWGFRYPSMAPLTRDTRGEFMKAYRDTDWVRVAVHSRKDIPACYSYLISRFQDPAQKPLDFHVHRGRNRELWAKLGSEHVPTAVMIRQPGQFFGGLNKMSVPELEVYKEYELYTGAANVYWTEEEGEPCVAIRCAYYPRRLPGENCQHLYFDKNRVLRFSMRYDSKLLPHWNEIQKATLSRFESFIRR
ncbi:hypothetical protein [Stutzerimonas nosocomialis]|uniref:hypothetical protein n=1 Tax=Stutzerimonas nosocomialis TaxID=1056496 RepID=UPI001108A26E|nr:hypothetical protein [Stutzerimonas nosocomialis]